MKRLIAALFAAVLPAGCILLDPAADSGTTEKTEHDYITGSRLPARHQNTTGAKVIPMTPEARDDIFVPKASPGPPQ